MSSSKSQALAMKGGKVIPTFAEKLDRAHHAGLRGIETELKQVPTDENGNVAIFKAVAIMGDDRKFSGHGDASPANVTRNILPHIIRMAETRAKSRALGDAINVGGDELDELEAETQPQVNGATSLRELQPSPGVEPRLDGLMQRVEELYFSIPVAYRPKPPWEKIKQRAEKNEDSAREAIDWLETFPISDREEVPS